MRYATIRTANDTRAVRVDGDVLVELEYGDVGAMLRSGAQLDVDRHRGRVIEHAVDSVELAPLVLEPGKIICVGANYADHIAEMGREPPEYPTLFAKFDEALIGARDSIIMPAVSDRVDWEAELTVVIGQEVRHASEEQAGAAIAGFTVANDISMRDWQNRTVEWLQGKTFEHTTPLGPYLVTPDELGGTAPDLAITCDVDGVRRQDSRTSRLVFGPTAIVAYVSTILTLRPGDVILTGTPGGVGHGMQPPVYLRSGQVVRAAVEGIGELVNRCVQESPA